MELRAFEQSDWYGFSGACRPDPETEPRIGWTRPIDWPESDLSSAEEDGIKQEEFEVTVICDKEGLALIGWNTEYHLPCGFTTACWLASRIGLPDGLRLTRQTIKEIGFNGLETETRNWVRI